MEKGKMVMSKGVADLLSKALAPSPLEDVYFFEGDLCQMAKAAQVARNLGIKTGVVGGIPYVVSKKDFDTVVKYIVDNQIEGYWHYTK